MTIIEKAKEFYYKKIINFKRLAENHKAHVEEVEWFIKDIIHKYPEADKEVLFLSVWLHDVGFSVNDENEDRAITGERLAREWLMQEKYNDKKSEMVLHCVRSRRCKDIQPETLEAKLVVFADSASHMTQGAYIDMLKEERDGSTYDPLAKLERDWRDLSFFPEMRNEFAGLYEAWKKLIESYRKIWQINKPI